MVYGPYSGDPLGDALFWYAMGDENGIQTNGPRPALPPLGPNATPDDQRLYEVLSQFYSDPASVNSEDLVNRIAWGDLAGGAHADPTVLQFLEHQASNANYDPGNLGFWGNLINSPFGKVVALYGSAAAGNAAGTALGPAVSTGTEAGVTAGTEAGFTAGTQAGTEAGLGLVPELEGGTFGAAPASSFSTAAGAGATAGSGGLTTAQLLKLGAAGVSLGTGLAGAGGGGGTTGSGTSTVLPGQEALLQRIRQLGLSTSREREALQGESTIRQTAQANASPQELLASVRPAIAAVRDRLQKAFKTASGLGPSAGGQIERQEQKGLGDAGTLLQQLLAAQPAAGVAGLNKSLQNFRTTNLAELPTPVTTNKDIPGDFGNIEKATVGASNINKLIDQQFGATPTSTDVQARAAVEAFRTQGHTQGLQDEEPSPLAEMAWAQ